jgi:hypothetical protein
MQERHDGFAKEKWLWRAYGEGVVDALKTDPEREITFIHRIWESDMQSIMEDFGSRYPGTFDVSFKYARARIHSTPKPAFAWDLGIIDELRAQDIRGWWNLRNDDLFCFRWGDPEYARAFIKNMPQDVTRGYHMGSDGYVWARNFVNRDTSLNGELEIKKHWYNFMIWGRLGYDPSLARHFFEASLKEKYPDVYEKVLYETWASASKTLQQLNRTYFFAGDFQFAPEGCFCLRKGFHTVDIFARGESLPGTAEISIADYVELTANNQECSGITPVQAAYNMNTWASQSLNGISHLKENPALSKETTRLLSDIEALATMGHYYAAKILGTTELELYKATGEPDHKIRAVDHLKEARQYWLTYARIASSMYIPQELARAQTLDWNELAKGTLRDIEIAESTTF